MKNNGHKKRFAQEAGFYRAWLPGCEKDAYADNRVVRREDGNGKNSHGIEKTV